MGNRRMEFNRTFQLAIHCHRDHHLQVPFIPAKDVTWDMVHHLLHRLKKWGRP